MFEYRMSRNPEILSFQKKDGYYDVNIKSGTLTIRDERFSDWLVFDQIFKREEYGILMGFMKHNGYLDADVTIIDAGANVGYATFYFSTHIPKARIFAVEPSSENAAAFRMNVQSLANSASIKVYEKALSASDSSSFTLDRGFRDGKDWSIVTEPDSNGEIEGISVSRIMAENQLETLTLLKIDIEGAERFLFAPDADLSYLDRVRIISVEIHDEFEIREIIYKNLRDRGFLLIDSSEYTIGINKNLC